MTDTDIEYGNRIGTALKDASASFSPPRGMFPRVAERERQIDRRRASVRVGALGIAAVVIVSGIAWLKLARTDDSTPAFQPSGTEFRIADLGPATRHTTHGVTLTELSRDIGVNGTSQLTVEVGLEYQGGEAPVEVRCIAEDTSSMCVPDYAEAGVSVFRTATVEGQTNPFLWAWAQVPAGTAYVSYVDGQLSLWQRPVDGVAVFPDVYDGGNGDSEVAVAYSADGVELGRVDRNRRAAVEADQASRGISVAELDASQQLELATLTDESFTTCLTEAGATFDGPSGTLPSGTDAGAVWHRCITATKTIVTPRLAELGVTFRNSNG
jgi:hypothetical protein